MLRLRLSISMLCGLAVAALAGSPDATKIDAAGMPNFYRVADNLYRSAQPSALGLSEAQKIGIKTVINLRAFHSDKEELVATNLKSERIYFKTWHPEEEDVVRFLKIVSNTNSGPFLVHCQHGADRTGTMVAIYRMAVQGWTRDAAIKEMVDGGYGYHAMWKNLVRYLNEVDVPALRRKAGL